MGVFKNITCKPSVGTCFNKGLEIYKSNFVPLFLASLLTALIGIVTLGICAAPMNCGLMAMILALLRSGTKPEVGDVFKKFDKFLPAFLSFLALGVVNFVVGAIVGIVPVIGWLASTAWSLAMAAVMQWALLLIVDQDAKVSEAISVPLKQIGNDKFWSVILVVFVANLIAGLGVLACGIGVLFTAPLASCMIVAAYEEAHGAVPASPNPSDAQIPASAPVEG